MIPKKIQLNHIQVLQVKKEIFQKNNRIQQFNDFHKENYHVKQNKKLRLKTFLNKINSKLQDNKVQDKALKI